MHKKNRFTRVYFKYITVLILAGMIILGVVLFAKTRGTNDETQPETSTSSETETVASTETTTEELPTEPTLSALDMVAATELIQAYYQAKTDDDTDALNRLVDSETEFTDADVITSDSQIIDHYDNFKTYVMRGATDNDFIVYVKYDIFFSGIIAGAPSLNHFYVKKLENGEMQIYDRPLSAAEQAALLDTENSEEIQRLKVQVEEELEKACENLDLRGLMKMLTDGATKAEEVPEESATSAEENAPSAEEGGENAQPEGGEEAPAADA